ncbi:hypothetical protein GCM10027072_62820 [Streptomyces bullii]
MTEPQVKDARSRKTAALVGAALGASALVVPASAAPASGASAPFTTPSPPREADPLTRQEPRAEVERTLRGTSASRWRSGTGAIASGHGPGRRSWGPAAPFRTAGACGPPV